MPSPADVQTAFLKRAMMKRMKRRRRVSAPPRPGPTPAINISVTTHVEGQGSPRSIRPSP